MLELIADYAVREALTVLPGFTTKKVRWLIHLDAEGRYLGLLELGIGGKGNLGRDFPTCPEFPANEMQSGGKAHPIVESLNVVALHTKIPEEPFTPKDESKHLYYTGLLRELSATMPEALVAADALEDEGTLQAIRQDLVARKAKLTDRATVRIGSKVLVEDPLVASWWMAKRQEGVGAKQGSSICLVTGEPTTPLATHPKIGGLGAVGGLAIGSSLISFDKGAFSSYGLEQSANAAVSEEAAMRYRAGLNHLVSKGKKLGPLIVTYWFSGVVEEDEDPVKLLIDPSDQAEAMIRMRKLLEAFHQGERVDLGDYRYYNLTLSGAAGRVMLRDWQEGTYAQLVRATNAWFNDVAITIPSGLATITPPKFIAVAATTVREIDNLEAPMVTALWNSAFRQTSVPFSAVRGALNRTRIDILNDQIRPIRMGLLKAYINRNLPEVTPMQPYLNPDHPSNAYQAGRLMAVLANIQYVALGDVNVNIVQRFYPAASSTPALIFGRLTRQSNFHLAKIGGRLARHLEEKVAEIWGRIREGLPTTFSLEEQTLFALGYYQQLAQDAHDRELAKAAKKSAADQTTLDAEEA